MAKLVTVQEAAKALGYTEHYIRVLASSGKIPAIRRKYRWLFDIEEIKKAIFSTNSFVEKKGNKNHATKSGKGSHDFEL